MKVLCLSVLALCSVAAGKDLLVESAAPQASLTNSLTPLSLQVSLLHNHVNNKDVELLQSVVGRNLVEQIIEDALNSLRDVVVNGNDLLPPLDPFVLDVIGPYQTLINGINVRGSIRNVQATGLQWYVVNGVTFNALRLSFGLDATLPWFQITSNYDVEARILMISHRAAGNIRVFINRLEVDVNARLGTNLLGGHLVLRQLDIKLDISDTFIHIDGMTGSATLNALISSYIQSLTQSIIQDHTDAVSQSVSEQLFDVINDILKDYTLSDLLELN